MNNGSSYITLGYNFLQLTINAIEEMEIQGNAYIIYSNEPSNEEETWDNYKSKTRWNDNNIALPVLFNFYHGVELIIKGLTIQCGSNFETIHNLSILLQNLVDSSNPPDNQLINLLKEVITYDPNGFFAKNQTTSSKAYLLFRYPEMEIEDKDKKKEKTKGEKLEKKKQAILSNLLKGQQEGGLVTFGEIKEYAHKIKASIIDWKTNNKQQCPAYLKMT